MQQQKPEKNIEVLLLDSDELFLNVSKECLKLQGRLNITTAKSSDEALTKIETADIKPDVIVCGHLMPTTDCFEFLKTLRSKGDTTPFILLAPDSDEETAITAIELGANAFIEKHGNPEDTYPTLKKSIETLTNNSPQTEKHT